MTSRLTRCLAVALALALSSPPAGWAQSQAPAGGQVLSLRLVQVVPRLPIIHLYDVIENGEGQAVAPGGGTLSALVGDQSLPVQAQKPPPISIVFLIDVSASLRAAQYDLVKDSIYDWINSLGPDDRAAIVTFGSTVQLRSGFSSDKASLIKIVAGLQARDQNTLFYQGLVDALTVSRQLDAGLPARRAIVVASDGMDDQTGGAGRAGVMDALALDPVPIYGIGATADRSPTEDAALKDFSEISWTSGGDFRRVTDLRSLTRAFTDLRAITTATSDLVTDCPACEDDGRAAVVKLFLTQTNNNLVSQSVTVRMVSGPAPPPAPTAPQPQPPRPLALSPPPPPVIKPWYVRLGDGLADSFYHAPILWGSAGMAALFAVVLGAAFLARRRHALPPSPAAPAASVSWPSNATVVIGEFEVRRELAVSTHAQLSDRRLRVFPLGRNELAPFDVVFREGLSIGRTPEADIVIPNDQQVSARHCMLTPDLRGIRIEDAGSRNGTRVNGVPITKPVHIETDSIVGIGRTELRVRILAPGMP